MFISEVPPDQAPTMQIALRVTDVDDFHDRRIRLCDLDECRRGPFVVDGDRLPGSTRFMAPEEHRQGATVDERTTVFNLGRTGLVLLDTGNLDGEFRGTAAAHAVLDRATRLARQSATPRGGRSEEGQPPGSSPPSPSAHGSHASWHRWVANAHRWAPKPPEVRTPVQRRTSPGRSSWSMGAAFSDEPHCSRGSIHMSSNSLPSGSVP